MARPRSRGRASSSTCCARPVSWTPARPDSLEIVSGIASHVRGEPLPEAAADGEPLPLEAVHQELSRYRYCTTFFVEGDEVDPAQLEEALAPLGDSLLVVGSRGAVKAHVHTDEPGLALAVGTAVGVLEAVEVNEHAHADARPGGTPGGAGFGRADSLGRRVRLRRGG